MQVRLTDLQGEVSGAWRLGLRPFLFPLVAIALLTTFFCLPWSFEHKAHAYLHGLCAQRPSHSLTVGGQALPFDARMTGIYGGFFMTSAYLLARGRYAAWRLPNRVCLATLALFVLVLGADGFNSTLADLGLPHPYGPDNRLRLATGLLTGISLGVGVCFMLATTFWRAGRSRQATVSSLGEVGAIVALQVPFALLVLSGVGAFYAPIALLLIGSATAVVAALTSVVVVLLRFGDRPFGSPRQAAGVASVALIVAVALIGAISVARFVLERWTNAPPLT